MRGAASGSGAGNACGGDARVVDQRQVPDLERRTPYYGASRFTDDAQRDEYQCPQGQPLPRRKTTYTEAEVLYRADATACNVCPVKAECTESSRGRIVHRSLFAEYLDRSWKSRFLEAAPTEVPPRPPRSVSLNP